MKKHPIRNILFIILGVIAAFMITGFVLLNRLTTVFSSSAGNHPQVLRSSAGSGRKALVVYQPSALSDATEKTALQIAKGLNKDGYQVTVNHPGRYLSTDLSGYAAVAFGSPVYGGKLSPVLLDYMKNVTLAPSQKALVFDTGAADTSPELDDAASLLRGGTVAKAKVIVSDSRKEQKAYRLGADL